MILDSLVDKLYSYWSWLYYRRWEIWELKIAVLTIAAILFVLLWWLIARRRRKARARITHANQGPEGSSVISAKKGKRIKKIAIIAIVIAGLIDLSILCYRRPRPTNGFYLRSRRTGKLIGPVNLPKGYLPPSLDEQTYIVAEPAESELEVRNRLLRTRVTDTMLDVPLAEVLDQILIAYFGNKAPPVRIDVADESKMPRVSIDAKNVPLYEVLCNIASQANVYISIGNGTIVLSQKEFKDTSISIETPQPKSKLKSEVEAAPEFKKSLPKITFEKVVHDFGEVGPNTKNTGEFKFTNTGDALLKITKLRTLASVVAKLDKNKEEYTPGESGAVKVEWNSGTRPWLHLLKVVVHSNDRANPEITLTIQAQIVLKVACEPNRLKLVLDKENAGYPKVTLRSLESQPFSITGFRSTGDCITAEFDPAEEATKFVLEPKVNMEKLQNNLNGRIIISTTHADSNVVYVPFSTLPGYTVDPPMLVVFNTEPKKPVVRKILVFSNYGKYFEIESVSSNSNVVGIKILKQTKISDGYQLDLEITPPAANGNAKFMDELSVNIKGGEKLTVRCNGYYPK
jgi:hypothetical protein